MGSKHKDMAFCVKDSEKTAIQATKFAKICNLSQV